MNDDLRTRLREGDPLPPGESLTPPDAARIRQAMLAETAKQPARYRWPVAALAAAVVTVVAGALFWTADPVIHGEGGPMTTGPAVATHSPEEAPRDRQVRFTTRGGTRVIWMLKPTISAP